MWFVLAFIAITLRSLYAIHFGFTLPAEAYPTEFPFHVNVMQSIGKNNYSSFCGGSLIDTSWILTAAHCILPRGEHKRIRKNDTFLSMGTIYRNASGGQIRAVEKFHIHPKYARGHYAHDIALIKAAKPFKTGRTVKKIRLSNNTNSLNGTYAYLTGFGEVNDFGDTSPKLRKATLRIGRHWQCFLDKSDPIDKKLRLCGVSWADEGGKACEGDNGGPLFTKEKGKYLQIGITSQNTLPLCSLHITNSIHTRVAPFLPWIRNVTKIMTL